MKNLEKLFNEVVCDANNLGIDYGKVRNIKINYKAKKRLGRCTFDYKSKSYEIDISSFLLEDYVDDKIVKNTIMHELLHTCPNCMNHKYPWQRLASFVNDSNLGYNITRVSSYEPKGLKDERTYKYIFICDKCGSFIKRQRASNFTKNPERYRCTCGGKLKRV